MNHATDVTSRQAYQALQADTGAVLVDVRTAATATGYRHAYNISDGFEGPPDRAGRRTPSGWKNNELPWRHLP